MVIHSSPQVMKNTQGPKTTSKVPSRMMKNLSPTWQRNKLQKSNDHQFQVGIFELPHDLPGVLRTSEVVQDF